MKKIILGFLALVTVNTINAQVNKVEMQKDWRELMQDPNANFYDVQKAANSYWETHDKEEKGSSEVGFTFIVGMPAGNTVTFALSKKAVWVAPKEPCQ